MAQIWTFATSGTTNDIYLDGFNSLAAKEDAEALANIVKNRQQTIAGELQYNITAGLPYFTTVFAHPSRDLRIFESFMVSDAESVPGVLYVNTFSAEVNGEVLNFNMDIATVFGNITVSNG